MHPVLLLCRSLFDMARSLVVVVFVYENKCISEFGDQICIL